MCLNADGNPDAESTARAALDDRRLLSWDADLDVVPVDRAGGCHEHCAEPIVHRIDCQQQIGEHVHADGGGCGRLVTSAIRYYNGGKDSGRLSIPHISRQKQLSVAVRR